MSGYKSVRELAIRDIREDQRGLFDGNQHDVRIVSASRLEGHDTSAMNRALGVNSVNHIKHGDMCRNKVFKSKSMTDVDNAQYIQDLITIFHVSPEEIQRKFSHL